MKFPGDFVDEGVPYTVMYSVILITEQALVVVGMGGSKGSTMAVAVLSGDDVDSSIEAALTSPSGGP